MQETTKKRRLDEGPWARGNCSTYNKMVIKIVTQEKWTKARFLIKKLKEDIAGYLGKTAVIQET